MLRLLFVWMLGGFVFPLYASEPCFFSNKIEYIDWELSKDIRKSSLADNPKSFNETHRVEPLVVAPTPEGGVRLGWMEKHADRIHVSNFDKNLQPERGDFVHNGVLRDLVGHEKGYTVLFASGSALYLDMFDTNAGQSLHSVRVDSSGMHDPMHLASISYNSVSGDHLVYFGHGGVFQGRRGSERHEGDALVRFNKDFSRSSLWDWGCSHSIDLRVAFVGNDYATLCLSDVYPAPGFSFNHNKKHIDSVWADTGGNTEGKIGGMIVMGEDVVVAYSKGSGNQTLSFVEKFNAKSGRTQFKYSVMSPVEGTQENLKIANWGEDKFLVSWNDKKGRWFRLFNQEGEVVQTERIEKDVYAVPRSDFATLSNGDIVWASYVKGKSERVRLYKLSLKDAAKLPEPPPLPENRKN